MFRFLSFFKLNNVSESIVVETADKSVLDTLNNAQKTKYKDSIALIQSQTSMWTTHIAAVGQKPSISKIVTFQEMKKRLI